MDYQNAIDLIITFKKNFEKLEIEDNKKQKVPKKLMSELGEFYVLRELNQRFKGVTPKGGAGSYDIAVGDMRIEVKTSLFKKDRLYNNQVNFWGWTVKRSGQKKENKFDFLVGVTLDESWIKSDFYIFSYEDAYTKNSDVKIQGYGNIERKINVFQEEQDFLSAIDISPDQITEQERYINQNKSEFLSRWDKIKK